MKQIYPIDLVRKLLLTAFCLLGGFYVFGQTELQPGDVAIVGVNANNGACGGGSSEDIISIVFFKDILRNTEFLITDNGYERNFPNRWGTNEGIYRIRYNGTVTIPRGTILKFRFPNSIPTPTTNLVISSTNSEFNKWNKLLTASSSNFMNLNVNGDQLYILQSNPPSDWLNIYGANNAVYNGNVLYAFSTSDWQPFANSAQESGLHPDVDPCYKMNPASGVSDFLMYNGLTTTATQVEWIERIRDSNNWLPARTSCSDYNAAYTAKFQPINYKLPIADLNVTLSANNECLDNPGNVSITFNFPTTNSYTVIYTDGTFEYTLTNVQNGHTVNHPVEETTTFSVLSINEYPNGCLVYPNLTDAFVTILVAPELEPHFYMCSPAFLEITNVQTLQDVLSLYDIELYIDVNEDGIPDDPTNPMRLYMENSGFPFGLLAYLDSYNQTTPILSGNYIVRVFFNDKGGFPLPPATNTSGATYNSINPAYTGCYAETSTKLTVYNTVQGTLTLSPAVTDNEICLTDTTTYNILVDNQPYGSFQLYETGFGNDADGNPINYVAEFTSSDENVLEVDPDTGQITPIASGEATITLTVKAPNPLDPLNPWMCVKTSELLIRVVDGPTAGTIAGPTTICHGQDFTYSVSGNSEAGTWSVVSGAATITSGGVLNATAAGTVIIRYTVTGTNGCEDVFDDHIITVNDPSVPTLSGLAPDYCHGQGNVELADIINGVEGIWSPNEIIDTQVNGIFTKTFTPNAGQCVETTPLTYTYEVNFCAFGAFASAVYLDSNVSAPNDAFFDMTGQPGNFISNVPAGNYYTSQNFGDYEINSGDFRLRGAELKVFKGLNGDICEVKIHWRVYEQGSPPPAFSERNLNWKENCENGQFDDLDPCLDGDQKWGNVNNPNQGLWTDLDFTNNCPGDYVLDIYYSYYGSNSGSCNTWKYIGSASNPFSNTFTLIQNSGYEVSITGNNVYCVGDSIALNASSIATNIGTAPFTYTWTGPGGYTFTGQNLTRNNAAAAMTGDYTVTVTDACGEEITSDPLTVSVTVVETTTIIPSP